MKKLEPVKAIAREHMSWSISLARSPAHLYVVVKGYFELSEFNEMLDDVSALKESLPDHPVLFSDLEFEVSHLNQEEVARVSSHFIAKNPALAESKVAIVMKTDHDVSLAHGWKEITQPSSTTQISIFQNESKARKWLAKSA